MKKIVITGASGFIGNNLIKFTIILFGFSFTEMENLLRNFFSDEQIDKALEKREYASKERYGHYISDSTPEERIQERIKSHLKYKENNHDSKKVKFQDLNENKWLFKQKGENSEIDFHVDFELKNKVLNLLMTKSFDIGLKKIADAFEKRAVDLFKNT